MGFAYALGYTILIYIMIFYILGSIGVGVICYLITNRIIPSVLLAIICLISVPTYLKITDKIEKEKYAKLKQQEWMPEAHRRRNNLLHACKTESKMTVYQKIPAQSGIFIEGNEYRYGSSHPVVDRFLPKQQREEMQQQLSDLHKKCTNNCHEQYEGAISWVNRVRDKGKDEIIKLTDAAFVQTVQDNIRENEWTAKYFTPYFEKGRLKKEYILSNTYGESLEHPLEMRYFYISGTKEWWREAGLTQVAKDWARDWDSLKDTDIVRNPVPNLHIYATYRLTIYDISTVADRQKGIRRGRIAFEDIKTNQVLSEYIGFDMAPDDEFGYHRPSSLNCFSDEKRWNEYLEDGRLNPDDNDPVFEHFFNHAVDKTRKAKIKKVTVFP
ncbi:hypothetical protein [Alysiella filiformis]|nr:hypothetical protein [Alysiella filiformis]QMT32371.1 hypothetical protein H3L97_05975 [Alysiella filiformis]UBQ56708.1 hypothetical protein JF568_02715 [Alysiella filiformis DSM 16848]